MAIENVTTFSLNKLAGYHDARPNARKPFARIEVRAASLVLAEAKLRKKANEATRYKANWLVEVRYYESSTGKFLMSGTPMKLEKD